MKEIDLSTLVQTDSMYEKASIALSERFKGAWDDEVHNSFHLLLTQIDENHTKIHSGSTEAEEIYNAAIALNIDGLCQTAECLCREVNSL